MPKDYLRKMELHVDKCNKARSKPDEVECIDVVRPPKFPLSSIEIDADLRKKCDLCGSSLKRKLFIKVLGCYQPECANFWQTSI